MFALMNYACIIKGYLGGLDFFNRLVPDYWLL